jgi:glycosyl transferase family 87
LNDGRARLHPSSLQESADAIDHSAGSRAAGHGAPHNATPALVAALVVAAFLTAFAVLHYGFYTRDLLVDTPIYEHYGDLIVHHGEAPYRDFAVEYPPGALPAFAIPSLGADAGDFSRYSRLFEVLMLLCGAAAAGTVGFVLARQNAPWPRLAAGTLLAGLAPLALGPVVLSRFDLWPAALTIGALAALLADRRVIGFALLGVAVAAKVYPAALVPFALVYVWRRDGRREAAICAGVLVGALALVMLPFLVLAPEGVWESLSGQASRPLQIESLGASLLLAGHQLFGLNLTEVSSHGSDNLSGRLPDLLAAFQSLLMPLTIAALAVAFARGNPDRARFIRYCAAALCAFIALGKVLSPQYLIWLIPLIPLVRGRRGIAAAAFFVAAMVLTQLWFPSHYIDLVYGLDARVSWLVLARDLVLVALLVVLLWPRARAPRIGRAVVAGLALVAAAAVGAAAASSSGPTGPTHSGLLDETGVASSCARPRAAPASTPGTVGYEASTFPNAGGGSRCVTVVVTATRNDQMFSAAYKGSLDPADPRARYLGDAGTCTNIAPATGRSLSYSLRASGAAPVVVEVESCSSARTPQRYSLDVRFGGGPPVAYRSATAARRNGIVTVRWSTGSRTGARFAVFRERNGIRSRVAAQVTPAGRDAYAVRDHGAPPHGSLRYWIRATSPDGSWSWHGPIRAK